MMKKMSPSPEAFTEQAAELADVLAQKQDLLRDIRSLVNVQAEPTTPAENMVDHTRELVQQGKSQDDIARDTLRYELPAVAA